MGAASLLMTERLGAQVWVAPVGANPNDADAWTPLSPAAQANGFMIAGPHSWGTSGLRPHVDKVDEIAANLAKAEAGRYYGYPGQRYVIGIDAASLNERSKPVGLTKNHKYTDEDGDFIEVEPRGSYASEDVVASFTVTDCASHEEATTHLRQTDSVPLAINALGYDRAELLDNLVVQHEGYVANGRVIRNEDERREVFAKAVAFLKSVDRYDQRDVQRKAAEAEAAAKREADYARHKQESFDRSKLAYADAIRDQIASGIDADSTAKVQAALSAYETARRKFEGLPH